MKTKNLSQRRGYIAMSGTLLRNDPQQAYKIFKSAGLLIIRAEHLFDEDIISYTAIHPKFDIVPPQERPPWYELNINNTGKTWKIIFTRRQ